MLFPNQYFACYKTSKNHNQKAKKNILTKFKNAKFLFHQLKKQKHRESKVPTSIS